MKTRLSILLNVILIALLGFGVFKFFIQGSSLPTDDGRTALVVKPADKNYILAEMRSFLERVQEITAAIGENDMETVSSVAAKAGEFSLADVPPSIIAIMPIEFKSLGMDTHALFRDLSEAAKNNPDPQAVATSLSDLMLNCTACHAGYRLDLETTGG